MCTHQDLRDICLRGIGVNDNLGPHNANDSPLVIYECDFSGLSRVTFLIGARFPFPFSVHIDPCLDLFGEFVCMGENLFPNDRKKII